MDEGMSFALLLPRVFTNMVRSNYLEGAMCIGVYIIIALAFYVYPDDAGDKGVGLMLTSLFSKVGGQ
jgi:hypothetical protein